MSEKRKIIPDNAPFSREEADWLSHFFTQMSPEQATWLSGFVSGMHATQLTSSPAEHRRPLLHNPLSEGRKLAPAQTSSPSELLILFGSESGNAEGLAADAKKAATKAGFKATLKDMGEESPSILAKYPQVLIFVSTWGEGDPPERAAGFYKALMATDAPRFDGLQFAVLGLGDTSYEQFCKMGKDFDQRLQELGATRIVDRIDCDVDYESAAQEWTQRALKSLKSEQGGSGLGMVEILQPATSSEKTGIAYGKKNPFPATLTDRVVLNGTGSNKETLHLELSLEGSGMQYQPGDALAVVPVNCDEVVTDIIRAAGLRNEQPVTNKAGESVPLHDHIMRECDATVLSKVFIEKYHQLQPNPQLENLLLPENKPQLQEFIWGREIVDLLIDFPIENLSPDNLIQLLRRLPPRLYSIASSQSAVGDEVHLTVAAVRYYTHRRNRKGVCSTFLADRVDIGEQIPVYVQPNKHFKLPENGDTPIIMVGPGTGIAPFRAFMQERQATDASGKNWLFFGDQHFSYDFLYQLDWIEFFNDGLLTRIDTAFSRDTPEKVYVQHRMLQHSKELYDWLQQGAYFYVCGDASRMANDVHAALLTILEKEGSMSTEDAQGYLENLKKEKRYQRDVY
jgi:sulfite reductase (NADPH) flavoprotein alpha-component